MTVVECGRCGNEYDTERETPKPTMNSQRCPACGCENDPAMAPTPDAPELADTLARTDGGVPDLSRVVEQLDTDGEEVHLHVHYHTE